MNNQFMLEMEECFRQYARDFYSADEQIQRNILLKEEHTAYVVRYCAELAAVLELGENDRQLAAIIGLFHDIGRFKQYTLYRTFSDRKSVNHAVLGLEELQGLKWLSRFKSRERKCIEFAIMNHNTLAIPAAADPWFRLHAAIVRDADKLDIYRVLEPDGKIPLEENLAPSLLDDLQRGRQSDYRNMISTDDHKLIRLNWIYDVNFSWTMRQIAAKGYVPAILDSLPKTSTMEDIRLRLFDYMEQKCQPKECR